MAYVNRRTLGWEIFMANVRVFSIDGSRILENLFEKVEVMEICCFPQWTASTVDNLSEPDKRVLAQISAAVAISAGLHFDVMCNMSWLQRLQQTVQSKQASQKQVMDMLVSLMDTTHVYDDQTTRYLMTISLTWCKFSSFSRWTNGHEWTPLMFVALATNRPSPSFSRFDHGLIAHSLLQTSMVLKSIQKYGFGLFAFVCSRIHHLTSMFSHLKWTSVALNYVTAATCWYRSGAAPDHITQIPLLQSYLFTESPALFTPTLQLSCTGSFFDVMLLCKCAGHLIKSNFVASDSIVQRLSAEDQETWTKLSVRDLAHADSIGDPLVSASIRATQLPTGATHSQIAEHLAPP
jgi:hypothetical protein